MDVDADVDSEAGSGSDSDYDSESDLDACTPPPSTRQRTQEVCSDMYSEPSQTFLALDQKYVSISYNTGQCQSETCYRFYKNLANYIMSLSENRC